MEIEKEWLSLLHQLAVLSVQLFIVSCVNFFLDVESNAKRAFLAIYCLPIGKQYFKYDSKLLDLKA